MAPALFPPSPDDDDATPSASSPPPPSDDGGLYAALNVPRDATPDDVRRAYRSLAAACHPDKVADPTLRPAAAEAFARLQRAYEVLADPATRQVYDIYGAAGLEAGLEVGPVAKSPDDLRVEWERFRARQAASRMETRVAHRGAYVVKLDAADAMTPYDPDVARVPELVGMAMSTQVQMPLSDSMGATLGGQMGVRGGAGGGAVLAGVRRVLDPATTVDAHAQLGLRSLLSLATTRQLGDRTSASVALAWQPGGGLLGALGVGGRGGAAAPPGSLGLTLTSTRRLTTATESEVVWTLGPPGSAGAAWGVTRRGERWLAGGRLEVGAVTGVSGRVVFRPAPATALRCVARAGTAGVEVEVGASRAVSEFTVAGLGLSAGTSGVCLRPRLSRGGHTFDFPILLARGGPAGPEVPDAKAFCTALFGPPLAAAALHVLVLRPLLAVARKRAALAARSEAWEALAEARASAAASEAMLGPPARRRAAKEAASPAGLVVVAARYGTPSSLDSADAAAEVEAAEAAAARANAASQGGGTTRANAAGAGGGAGSGGDGGRWGAPSPTSAAPDVLGPAASTLPEGCVAVTAASRLLVERGALALGAGVPRTGLLGFVDPAPGEDKALSITFVQGGRAWRARVPDGEGAALPGGRWAAPLDGALGEAALAAAASLVPAGAEQARVAAGVGADTAAAAGPEVPDVAPPAAREPRRGRWGRR